MKKILSILCIACIFCGCARQSEKKEVKPVITATLFPQYDFCRQIVGDRAEVILLLPPGMESHNYEPSVADIKKIAESDLFLYTGENMEPWAERILDGLSVKAVDLSENIQLCEHRHGDEHEHGHSHGEDEEHGQDPHIWTDPNNCITVIGDILSSLCEIDGENGDFYRENAEEYVKKLKDLDSEFKNISNSAKEKVIVHGGRASMTYFANRYGFTFISAVDSCSSYSEPSASKLTYMINYVKQNNISAVFCEEMTEPKFAKVISEETGAEILLLHTCHNLSRDEFERGETYISLMKKNAQNLKKALGVE